MPCQMVPPTAPMAKALPKSERITHGLVRSKGVGRAEEDNNQSGP